MDREIIGLCNGLVCVYDKFDEMELWNPATEESEPLQHAYINEETLDFNLHEAVMGFCFDPVSDQYKVVRSVFLYGDCEHTEFQECEVKVHTLGANGWRRIDDPPSCLLNRHMVPQVNGALHWLSGTFIDPAITLDSRIISFDAASEEFRIVPWIEAVRRDDTSLDVTIGVLQDCLSALCWYHGDTHISVWSMKEYGVKESWTRLFLIQMPVSGMEFESIEPLVLQSNGEIILKSDGELYVYDTLHNTIIVHTVCDIPAHCYNAHTFVESLVSIASLYNEEAL